MSETNIKLCFLNDKINGINTTLDTKINDTKELFDTTKQVVDLQQIEILNMKQNISYSKTESDAIFATKQEVSGSVIENAVTYDDIYTKTQSNELFVQSVDLNNTLSNYYQKSEVYNKTESDAKYLSDTTNYYTKTEINNKLDISGTNIVLKDHILPDTNEAYDLGSVENKFRDLYLSGTTLHIGDEKISRDTNGGIKISNLIIGDDVNGKLKLGVEVRNNKRVLKINDNDSVENTVDVHELSELMQQNAASIVSINEQITNILALLI